MVPVMIIVALMTLSNTIVSRATYKWQDSFQIFHLYLPIFQSSEPLTQAIISSIVKFGSFHEYQVREIQIDRDGLNLPISRPP